jgi:hypothetical protein
MAARSSCSSVLGQPTKRKVREAVKEGWRRHQGVASNNTAADHMPEACAPNARRPLWCKHETDSITLVASRADTKRYTDLRVARADSDHQAVLEEATCETRGWQPFAPVRGTHRTHDAAGSRAHRVHWRGLRAEPRAARPTTARLRQRSVMSRAAWPASQQWIASADGGEWGADGIRRSGTAALMAMRCQRELPIGHALAFRKSGAELSTPAVCYSCTERGRCSKRRHSTTLEDTTWKVGCTLRSSTNCATHTTPKSSC